MNRTKKEAKTYRADLNKSLLHHIRRAQALGQRIDGAGASLAKATAAEDWDRCRELSREIQSDAVSHRVDTANIITAERKLAELDREEAAERVAEAAR
ncbi:MAG: hypothetical protein GY838_12885 [bacterium]|nr:hypothetical protein [bacterium]